MKQAPKKGACVILEGPFYSSLMRRFEVLSGREFSSKVFSFSAYKAVCEMMDGGQVSGEKLIPFLKDTIRKTVGGTVTLVDISREAGGVVRIEGCAEAIIHGPSDAGVCYISLGIIEGVVGRYVGRQVHVAERKCLSKGDAFCEFAVMPGGGGRAHESAQEVPQGLSDLVQG